MKKCWKRLGWLVGLPGLLAASLSGPMTSAADGLLAPAGRVGGQAAGATPKGNAAMTFASNPEMDASSFAPRVNFTSERDPSLVAVGDLDGDGKAEMITVNYQSNLLSIFRNTSRAGQVTPDSFAPRVDFPAGPSPASVALGDLDGDGKLDIVVANDYGADISVYRNTSTPGNISFAPRVNFPAGTHPVSVGIADLDGDGKPDIAVVNAVLGPSTVGVFRNSTTAGSTELSFADMVEFPTGDYSFNLAVGDLDGDGKPDLAVANENSTSVSLLRNVSGPGSITPASFEPRIDLAVAGRAFFVSLGDLDGDGRPDVAVAHDGGVSVFQNLTSPGAWTPESFGPSLELSTGGIAYDVAIGDLDRDGKLDLAVTILDSPSVSVFQNRSSGGVLDSASFGPKLDFGGPANSVVIGDLDGDGKPDLITSRNPSLSVYRNTIGETPIVPGNSPLDGSALASRLDLGAGDGPIEAAIGDLDGDGKPDVVVVNNYDSTMTLYRNISSNGSLTADSFAPRVDWATGSSPYGVALSDIDGDGKLDIVVPNSGDHTVSVYRNIGSPGDLRIESFAERVDFSTGNLPLSVAIGDWDGDGRPDIVTANHDDNSVSVLRNLSTPGSLTTRSFAPRVDFAAGPHPHSVVIGDLDGDGKPDLAVANYGNLTVSVFRNTSTAGAITADSFSTQVVFGGGGVDLAVGDLDGDGKLDLAVANWPGQLVSLLRNTSTPGEITPGSFAEPFDLHLAGNAHSVAITDLNGDGKPDLAVVTEMSSTLALFENLSTPGILNASSFGVRVDFSTGWNAVGIAAGDLSGDGKPDLVFCNAYDDVISIYRNTTSLNPGEGGGTVNFANFKTSLVFDVDGVTPLLAGLSYWVQLYAGPTPDSLQPVGPATHIAPVAGRFVGGTRVIPGVAPLQTATVQIRAWSSAAGTSYEQARAAGGKTGVSPLLQVITGGGGVPPRPPANLIGLQSFSLTVDAERALSIVSPPDRNAGELVEVPIQLASTGDVGGMNFLLQYDPDYLSAPEVSWDPGLTGALKQLNTPSLGQIRMVFALPATTVPGGTQTLATVSFRARTLLADATTALGLQIVDVASPTGDPILHGTGVMPGHATLFAGTASPGDNNGNGHLDIGDVTLLLRLLAQLDSTRAWDITRNDLNQNGRLDSGDVIKMLRAISAIDAPPPPPAAASWAGAEAVSAAEISLPGPVATLTPVRFSGAEGQFVTVQVRLQGMLKPLSGVAFALHYPVAALRLTGAQSHRTGPVVPGDAVAIWNVGPAQNNYAAQDGRVTLAVSTATPWPADGVVAELTFAVQPGATAQHLWPLALSRVEVTSNGFDSRPVFSLPSVFSGRAPLPGLLGNPRRLLSGECHLTLSGDAGATYQIEASQDLVHWTTLANVLNSAGNMPFVDSEAAHYPRRFYRARPAQ